MHNVRERGARVKVSYKTNYTAKYKTIPRMSQVEENNLCHAIPCPRNVRRIFKLALTTDYVFNNLIL